MGGASRFDVDFEKQEPETGSLPVVPGLAWDDGEGSSSASL